MYVVTFNVSINFYNKITLIMISDIHKYIIWIAELPEYTLFKKHAGEHDIP